jgi:hypothetical protein
MVRQNGKPNRTLGGVQESSKLKPRYAASRGEAHMFKPSNIRERHALRIASRAATLANVAIEETIGAAWIVAHAGNHNISPKKRDKLAKSIAQEFDHIAESVDLAPTPFTYYDDQLERLYQTKLASQVEEVMTQFSHQKRAAFEHTIGVNYDAYNRKQLAQILKITHGRCKDLCGPSQTFRMISIIKSHFRGQNTRVFDYQSFQPNIGSMQSIL